ncbi:E3 ubiquitin-protein ligase RNF8-like [Liolophura sinensis]|uniref:E3 ubiquitin-protein ligase RNF8-like n=1 Tax=Liolophura sinensis TaxID=3198878 RepID=UPI0031591F8A
METKVIPCLIRVGENHKKPRFIPLDGEGKITIGRSADVTVCLLSNMISRCHAILQRKEDGNWFIQDNKSLNGVAVNGERLQANVGVPLREGDLVQFGINPSSDMPSEFVYKYFPAARIKRPVKRSSDKVDSTTGSSHLKKSRLAGCSKSSIDSQSLTDQDDNVSSSQDINAAGRSGIKQNWSPFREYKEQLSEQDKLAKQKLKEYEEKLAEMQRLLKEKEAAEAVIKQELEEEKNKAEEQEKIVEELLQKEEEMKSEMEEKERKFEDEKEKISRKVQEFQAALEAKLKEKEAALLRQLTAQREALIAEKVKVEHKLQEEMDRALEEKDKQLEKELVSQRENLTKVIANKELEQKVLESQLKDTQSENAKQKEAALRAREDVLANFTDLMETELQCSICSELFIKAASLNCSHSFCQLCISQWMKRKKECPICRAPFTSFTRSIVLDSYIEKMVDQLSEELKERRKEMTKSREAEQKKFDEENNQSSSSTSGRGRAGSRRGRGRRRGRGSSSTATGAARGATQTRTRSMAPIVLSSDSEISQDTDEDSVDGGFTSPDSDIEGDPDAYYGGYGRCFICGSLGHWANGCPLR